jgi:hypothetical protein
MNDLSYILAGEANGCALIVYLAVAWVYTRNQTMYGYAEPNPQSIFISQTWHQFPDPSYGAYFYFSGNDLKQTRVQNLIQNSNVEKTVSYSCASDSVHMYRYKTSTHGRNNFTTQQIANQMCEVLYRSNYNLDYEYYCGDYEPAPPQPLQIEEDVPIMYTYKLVEALVRRGLLIIN